MQKEVERLGKMLQEETAMKDDLAGKLKALQDEKVTTDALVHRLREQLKISMPAAEVQNLLQAAEKRVFEICRGYKEEIRQYASGTFKGSNRKQKTSRAGEVWLCFGCK